MSESTWVVGMDGSSHARAALDWATTLAGSEITIRVVSAWQYPYVGLMPMAGSSIPALGPDMHDAIERDTQAIAAEAAAGTEATVVGEAMLGPAAQVLLDAAAEAALLIVGNRGRGGFSRLVLGSVSHQVACHAPVPVVIVPEGEVAQVRRVVIGVDNSENSIAALEWAVDAMPAAAELVAVCAWEPPNLGPDRLDDSLAAKLEVEASVKFEATVDRVERHVGAEGRFTRVFDHGRPEHVLRQRAEDADLMVVGARGHGGLAATILGSVTTRVIHDLACATAVVPHDAS